MREESNDRSLVVPEIGSTAPEFKGESVQGPVVALTHYRGRQNVLVWLSRGFTCPFCRRYMAQLASMHARFQALDAEILQIAPNLLSQARIFFKNYPLAFPYLCDTEKTIFSTYGLRDMGPFRSMLDASFSFGAAVAQGEFTRTVRASWLDTLASGRQIPDRIAHHSLHEMQQGMFVVDRAGLVRFARVFGPLENIPGNEELMEVLKGL